MRDPKVFGSPEGSTAEDGQDLEVSLVLQPLPGKHAENQYGSALSDIQNSDLAKCSFQALLPRENFSQSMPQRRLAQELKHFVKDHPDYVSMAPIEGNLVRLS
jgi:hypothetical protein